MTSALFLLMMLPVSKQCGMKTKRFTIKSDSDQLPISVLVSVPDARHPEALLQLAHGMCGCKERFIPFMEYMTSHGVACVANDHRGHGESVNSTDDLGYMYEGGSDALVEDMAQITVWFHDSYPDLPIYLLGHSMGSMAARVYAQRHDDLIDGLILCGSPSWNPLSPIGFVLTGVVSSFGGGHLRPSAVSSAVSGIFNRKFATEGAGAWTCSDPEVRKSFSENPLCNYVFTINGMHNVMNLMLTTYRRGEWQMCNPDMPVLFLSGDDDPCIGNEKRFHNAAKDMFRHGYHNVSSALYGGMRHEILNEKEKENVWKDILRFVKTAS